MSQWSLDRLLCNACENFRREGILMQQGAQIDSDEESSRPNSPQVDRPLADDFAELQDSFLDREIALLKLLTSRAIFSDLVDGACYC